MESDLIQQSLITWMKQHQSDQQSISPGYHYDMIHDKVRNQLYNEAIKRVVKAEEDPFVLDIGTGSGLLAMMAARAGAQHVFACEADATLASVARAVIEDNGLADAVTVLAKFSNEAVVGYGDDMPCKADVCVMEIFDSMLLGESVLPTMSDATKRLMTSSAKVVPASAQMYGAFVSSEWLFAHQHLQTTATNKDFASAPGRTGAPIQTFSDTARLFHNLELMSDEFECFKYDFSDPSLEGKTTVPVTATEDGQVHAVLIWWTLDMDGSGELLLSTRPHWESSQPTIPDRDHWRQAACVFQRPLSVKAGQTVQLVVGYESDQPFFEIFSEQTEACDNLLPESWRVPHVASLRMVQLFADNRVEKLKSAIASLMIGEPENILVLSDSSLLVLLAAQHASAQVVAIHATKAAVDRTASLLEHHGFDSSEVQLKCTEGASAHMDTGALAASVDTIDIDWGAVAILAEPYFHYLSLPMAKSWGIQEALRLCIELRALAQSRKFTSQHHMFLGARVMAQAINCAELWRRRGPLTDVEDFNMSVYNKLAPRASGVAVMELQPWAHVMKPVTLPFCLADIRAKTPIKKLHETTCAVMTAGTCHAIVMWVEYDLNNGLTISTSPETSGHRQAFWRLETPEDVTEASVLRGTLEISQLEISAIQLETHEVNMRFSWT